MSDSKQQVAHYIQRLDLELAASVERGEFRIPPVDSEDAPKTFAEVIDELAIVHVKLFKCVEKMEDEATMTHSCAYHARLAQKLNRRRHRLKCHLDMHFGNLNPYDQEVKL